MTKSIYSLFIGVCFIGGVSSAWSSNADCTNRLSAEEKLIASCQVIENQNFSGNASHHIDEVDLCLYQGKDPQGFATLNLSGSITDRTRGGILTAVAGYLKRRGKYQIGHASLTQKAARISHRKSGADVFYPYKERTKAKYDRDTKRLSYTSDRKTEKFLGGLFSRWKPIVSFTAICK